MSALAGEQLLREVRWFEGFPFLEPVVLFERLGKGAMGVVYRGHHLNLDTEVAVKCLDPEVAVKNPELVERFTQEARLAARIQSPHLLRVYDGRRAHGLQYIIMEYVDGETFEDRVERKGGLAPAEACTIILDVLEGLHAAHEAGIIHRDIKPANVLISAAGRVKLADLGIAKSSRSGSGTQTQAIQLLGTPAYMAPELFDGAANASFSTDLYAVGATLAFALMGKHAIDGETVLEVAKQVSEGFPDVRQSLPDTPEELCEVILRATSKKRDDRFKLVKEFAESLETVLNGFGKRINLADEQACRRGRSGVAAPPSQDTLNAIAAQVGTGKPPDPQTTPRPYLETTAEPMRSSKGMPRPENTPASAMGAPPALPNPRKNPSRWLLRLSLQLMSITALLLFIAGVVILLRDPGIAAKITGTSTVSEHKKRVPLPDEAISKISAALGHASRTAQEEDWEAALGHLRSALDTSSEFGLSDDAFQKDRIVDSANSVLRSFRTAVPEDLYTPECERAIAIADLQEKIEGLAKLGSADAHLLLLECLVWFDRETDVIDCTNAASAAASATIAADGGLAEACFFAGDLFWRCEPNNNVLSIKYYQQGDGLGSTDCQARLAYLYAAYYDDRTFPIDPSPVGQPNPAGWAAKLANDAVAKGSLRGMYSMYYILNHGVGVPKNAAKAEEYLQRAVDGGYGPAKVLK